MARDAAQSAIAARDAAQAAIASRRSTQEAAISLRNLPVKEDSGDPPGYSNLSLRYSNPPLFGTPTPL